MATDKPTDFRSPSASSHPKPGVTRKWDVGRGCDRPTECDSLTPFQTAGYLEAVRLQAFRLAGSTHSHCCGTGSEIFVAVGLNETVASRLNRSQRVCFIVPLAGRTDCRRTATMGARFPSNHQGRINGRFLGSGEWNRTGSSPPHSGHRPACRSAVSSTGLP